MANRRGARSPRAGKQRQFGLNGSSAPQTEREWVVYRAGVLEGIERAQIDAREKADLFLLRAKCSGVELAVSAAGLQTSAAFTPQLKKRRSA